MNIQIFGKNKCFDTKKAQRYFKERNIKFQFINLDEKEMSKKEFESVLRQVGIDSMIDPKAKDKELLTMLNYLSDKEDKVYLNHTDGLKKGVYNGTSYKLHASFF